MKKLLPIMTAVMAIATFFTIGSCPPVSVVSVVAMIAFAIGSGAAYGTL